MVPQFYHDLWAGYNLSIPATTSPHRPQPLFSDCDVTPNHLLLSCGRGARRKRATESSYPNIKPPLRVSSLGAAPLSSSEQLATRVLALRRAPPVKSQGCRLRWVGLMSLTPSTQVLGTFVRAAPPHHLCHQPRARQQFPISGRLPPTPYRLEPRVN